MTDHSPSDRILPTLGYSAVTIDRVTQQVQEVVASEDLTPMVRWLAAQALANGVQEGTELDQFLRLACRAPEIIQTILQVEATGGVTPQQLDAASRHLPGLEEELRRVLGRGSLADMHRTVRGGWVTPQDFRDAIEHYTTKPKENDR